MSDRPCVHVQLFVEEAARVLGENCAPNRCLNATRVCLDVMRHFNVGAFPLSVDAMAMNDAYWARISAIGRLPSRDELAEWIEAGAWALAMDTQADPTDVVNNAWNGHLVAIVQKEWLIDASAVQFHRPARRICVPDIFVQPVTRRFLKGKDEAVFESSEGARLSYRARLGDESWKEQPGFQPHEHNARLAREIIDRMTERRKAR